MSKRYFIPEKLSPKAIGDRLTGKTFYRDDFVFEEIVEELNELWEQVERFGKYAEEYCEENVKLSEQFGRTLHEKNKEIAEGNKVIASQDMEIARQHKLLDAMNAKLKELGVHDVFESGDDL